MNGKRLEVAANSVASACAAQAGGAARVELCAALALGGLTPSHASIALARERLDIALYVLIRPRPGDFVFHATEVETMRRDIATCVALGCDGVVIGALDAAGAVDRSVCADLLEAAAGLGVTFHRAFDVARDREQALEDIIALGCERVLTSGGQADAMHGAQAIAALVEQAGERLTVMPGAGITHHNIATLARATGAREFHASAKRQRASRQPARSALMDMCGGEICTDEAEVRALVTALGNL